MTTETSKKKRVVMPWMRKRPQKPKEELRVKQSAPPTPLLKSTAAEAEEIATSITMKAQQEAEAEAERIISQAKQEIQKIKRRTKIAAQKEAEAEAERIISQTNQEAEAKAEEIIKQAKQEAEAKAERIISQSKQEIQKIERGAEVAVQKETTEEKIEEPVPPQEEVTKEKIEEPVPPQEEVTEEKVEEPVLPQEEVAEEKVEEPVPLKHDSQTLYAGEVELAIAKPVDPKMASKLYNYLQTTPGIKLVQASGTWERGTTITVVLDKPVPLISTISSKIPEAEATAERPEKDGYVKGKRGVRRIKLTLKEG